MIDLTVINNLKTSTIFTNLFISYILVSILLIFILVNPFIVKRFALGEDFSNFMKEYYINNRNEGMIMDYLYSIILVLCTLKIFRLFNIYTFDKYNNLFTLLIFNNIISTIFNCIIRIYSNLYKGKSNNMQFIKDWANECSKSTYIWHAMYYSCILLFFLLLSLKEYDMFYPTLIISIYLFLQIIHS